MGEVIRCWLRQRLGAIIDLSPIVFGHYTRDGTLLAKLLYNYGIINETQLKTIIPTQDPALARVNLKNLRAWIKFIGIDLNDDYIEDISQGKGITSLHVFYKMFLCLETKDRLHFITLQKERERYIPRSRKFDVKAISEEALIPEFYYSESTSLNSIATVVDWHRQKFLQLIEDYKHQREKLDVDRNKKQIDKKCKDKTSSTKNEEIINRTISDDIIINDNSENLSVETLKSDKTFNAAAERLKIQTQADFINSVLDDDMHNYQNKLVDEIIARKILKEAKYERQMIEKLEKIRKEEDWISENRRLVESLMQEAKESNLRRISLEDDEVSGNRKRIEDEDRRLTELNKKLASSRLEKSEEYLNELGRLIAKDLAELAISSSDYKNLVGNDVPMEISREWKSLFIKGLTFLHVPNIYEFQEVNGESQIENEEKEEESEEDDKTIFPEISGEKREYFDENDLEDYLNMREPWINFIPEISEECQNNLNSGSQVLGHIVHELLTGFQQPFYDSSSAAISNFSTRAVLLGAPHDFPAKALQNIMAEKEIQLIDIPDTVNYCLNSYKLGISDSTQEDLVDNNSRTAALVGASINESLTRGEEISDEWMVKALAEYMKALSEDSRARGWLIINYPSTYRQMINLEATLAGQPLRSHNDRLSKHSKLFPNPSDAAQNFEVTTSHLTSFIRLKIKRKPSEAKINSTGEENDVVKFYINQGVASDFHYASLDGDTLHKLCDSIVATGNGFIVSEEVKNDETSKELIIEKASAELKPGFVEIWRKLSGVSKDSLERLAFAWEAQEEVYVKTLIETLSLRRFIFLTVIPYTSFIIKYMWEYMNRVDKRRNEILQNFRKAFNKLPPELRDDCRVKNELHCRVKDFQVQLWEICDARREKSGAKVKSIIRYHWTSTQIVIITNTYLSIVQAEIDRFLNTLYTIESYYLSILQKTLRNEPFPKVTVNKISFPSDTHVNKSHIDNEIEHILLNKNELLDLSQIICFKFLEENIENCQSIVNNYFQSSQKLLEESIRIKKPVQKTKRPSKSTKQTKTNGSGINENMKIFVDDNLLEKISKEWNYALRYELTRINTVLRILRSAWQSDINFLMVTIKQTVDVLEQNINELYKTELQNTNDIAKLFCLAIEHQKPVDEEITQEIENVFQLPVDIPEYYGFQMSQVGRLKDIFKRVAPSGFFCRNALKYMLEDIIHCLHGEFEGESLLPDSWLKLQPRQITEVINKAFGNTSHVNWRDFLIYAMDIAMPSQEQLLETLEVFRKKDKDCLGIVPKSVFYSLPLWFDDTLLIPSMNSWLHEDYERDEDYFIDSDKNSDGNSLKKVQMSAGEKSISFRSDSIKRKNLLADDVTSEEVRLNLIKELLGEIFLEDRNYVHYFKLLLYFCKDEDPRKGLANALSLTLNYKVSCNYEEGEEYMKKLIEEQGDRNKINQEIADMIYEILDKTIKDIFDFSKILTIANDDNVSLTKDIIEDRKSFPIFIETLDKPGENVDPASLIELNDIISSISVVTESSISSMEESEQLSQCQSAEAREQCYWISITNFEKLLWDLTPRLMEQTTVFGTSKSLIENLKLVYDEITCLNNQPGLLLIHKLINSEFVLVYLQNTSQFTWKSLRNVIKDILDVADRK